jgi:hypothetical protein
MASKPVRRVKKKAQASSRPPKTSSKPKPSGKARPKSHGASRPAAPAARAVASASATVVARPAAASPARSASAAPVAMSAPPVRRRFDLDKLRLISLRERRPAVRFEQFARPVAPMDGFRRMFDSFGDLEEGARLRALVQRVVAARRASRPVVIALGSEAIRGGISLLVIDLLRKGIATAIAVDAAGAIDDAEVALAGGAGLEPGTPDDDRVAPSQESSEAFARAAARARRLGLGLGRALGELLLDMKAPHAEASILAEAAKHNVPATVHVAIGCDAFHSLPGLDGAALGDAALRDFRSLCETAAKLEGGVWCGFEEPPIVSQAFVRAVAAARNLGFTFASATCARVGGPVPREPSGAGFDLRLSGPASLVAPVARLAVLAYGAS